MIESIRHKGLRLLWEKDDISKLPTTQISKIRAILTLLDNAEEIKDMNFPGSELHPLKGDLKGFWSVKVSANYRIIFRFKNESVNDINYVDYH
ncbi:type II toxin-antitoxin system RelE/ParE family toxin [Membranihabitans maritimus]|uniref:type II toxin-antitoxin system RelE/ParE family toxin n=1 Tax=Membranihabitans maritimus TaxID=2904244 RepID=UPI001F22C74B|nr:type II toxin-antitoxin system RelE/ParE family toxin [Membranihabitans maritimus]